MPLVGLLALGVGVAWCVNLFNFMDGADGLAAAQLISAQEQAMYRRYGYTLIDVPAAPVAQRLALILSEAGQSAT